MTLFTLPAIVLLRSLLADHFHIQEGDRTVQHGRQTTFLTLVARNRSATAKRVFHTRSSFSPNAERPGSCFVLGPFCRQYKRGRPGGWHPAEKHDRLAP